MAKPTQLIYSVGELAKLAGVSKHRIAGVLASRGVKVRPTGGQGKRIVTLSQLERGMPELVDSFRFRRDE